MAIATYPFPTSFQIPNLVLVRCVCHSLHGAASKDATFLPADLEFLVRESRNWFARSPPKRLQYKDLYAAINEGDMPQNLVQLSETRWLAWGNAVEVVLKQWLELKTHFNNHAHSLKPSDKCTIGRKLNDLYQTEINRLYLLFLKPITSEINKVNLLFQATDAEVHRYVLLSLLQVMPSFRQKFKMFSFPQVTTLFGDVSDLILSLARRVIRANHLPNQHVDGEILTEAEQRQLRNAINDPQQLLPPAEVKMPASVFIHLGQVQIPVEELNSFREK